MPRSSVTVLRGERSRDKLVRVDQLDQTRIDQALAGWTRAAER